MKCKICGNHLSITERLVWKNLCYYCSLTLEEERERKRFSDSQAEENKRAKRSEQALDLLYGGLETDSSRFEMKKLKGVWFDKNNQPVIIDGVAQRTLKKDEKLFYNGEVLRDGKQRNN